MNRERQEDEQAENQDVRGKEKGWMTPKGLEEKMGQYICRNRILQHNVHVVEKELKRGGGFSPWALHDGLSNLRVPFWDKNNSQDMIQCYHPIPIVVNDHGLSMLQRSNPLCSSLSKRTSPRL